MKVRILRLAHVSIMDGYEFYENRSLGLGGHFFKSIMEDIHALKISGGAHPLVPEGYHRKICKRFPYSIFYKVEGSDIKIYRVLDNRRDPEWISDKLN